MVDTKILFEIAKQAGDIIKEVYDSDSFEAENKSDKSPVTKADKMANNFIVSELQNVYADIPIISEESEIPSYEIRKKWSECFIVDPLDGTKEFIKKNGEFTVNIAYVQGQRVVEGVIHVPVSGNTYYTFGGSSYKNGKKITKAQKLRPFTILTSRSHQNEETKNYIDEQRVTRPDLKVLTIGSSLKLCLLAEGIADIYPRFAPTSEWDIAAGQAILEQAGGSVLEWQEQKSLVYNKSDLMNPFFKAST